jgi:hypothetical protein
MYDMNSEWDRYMLRYGGYSLQTLEDFMEDGIATYDVATDTYTIQCNSHDPAIIGGHDAATCPGFFTVTTSPEFATKE